MKSEERAEKAAGYKSAGMCNCCQAVMKSYADSVNVGEETLMQMGAGFGGGMGCMEATCGALAGAAMIAGLKSEGQPATRITKQLLAKFKEKCGATICGDLKGLKTGKVLCSCDNCVRNAVLSLEEVLS